MAIPDPFTPFAISAGLLTNLSSEIIKEQAQNLEDTWVGDTLKTLGLIKRNTEDNLRGLVGKALQKLFDEYPQYQLTGIIDFFHNETVIASIRKWIFDATSPAEDKILIIFYSYLGTDSLTRVLLERRGIEPSKIIPDFFECYKEVMHHSLDLGSIAILQAIKQAEEVTHKSHEDIKSLLQDTKLSFSSEALDIPLIKKRFFNASEELREYPKTVAYSGYSIPRIEVQKIFDWISSDTTESNLALLVDRPGTGKTVVMSRLLHTLEQANYVVLGIKADNLLDVKNRNDLQAYLELPASVETCIEKVVSEEPVIVLIDQLDALSISLSQDYDTLDLVYKLVLRLKRIPNTKIVVSSREFDINFDPKLSSLRHGEYRSFSLEPLTKDEIDKALKALTDATFSRLSERMYTFLSLPLNLTLYGQLLRQLDPRELLEEYYSLQQLYDEIWEYQIIKQGRSIPYLSEAINKLVDTMLKRQKLTAPVGILDAEQYRQANTYLQSINYIREAKSAYFFSHQTLFDYCYVRKFLAENLSLSQELLERSSQGLFERSQMLQVVAHLRGYDNDLYLKELQILLFSPNLRLHLRRLLIEWFASLKNITAGEQRIAIRLMQDIQNRSRFLRAARGNEAWFDKLEHDFFRSNMVDLTTQEAQPAKEFLASVITNRTDEVLTIVEPLSSNEFGRGLLWDCLYRLENWQSERAVDLLCKLIEVLETVVSSSYIIGSILERLANTNPKANSRVLRLFLEKMFDLLREQQIQANDNKTESSADAIEQLFVSQMKLMQPYRKLLEEYSFERALAKTAQNAPIEFVNNLLPWFVKTVRNFAYSNEREDRYVGDALFSYYTYSYHYPSYSLREEKETSFIHEMAHAIGELAKKNREDFLKVSKELQSENLSSVHFVLVQGYLADEKAYIDEIFNYLIEDSRRFELGNNEYDSCLLVKTIFQYGSSQQRSIIEEIILNMRPDWELKGRYLGATQKRFLSIIPQRQLSSKASKRLQELERNDRFTHIDGSPPVGTTFRAVSSPISREQIKKMSDKDLLNLMRKYDESTGWGMPREELLKGGIVEFSRAIAVEAKENPERFYNLVKYKFDNSIPVEYVGSVLSGMADSDAKSQWVFEIAQMYVERFTGFERISFCHSLEKRAGDRVPNILLDSISEWALHDPDPDISSRHWSTSEERHDWLTRGINAVRGVAVETVCRCSLEAETPQPDRVFNLLGQAINDPSPAVGACILQCIPSLFPYNQNHALDILNLVLEKHQALLNDLHTYALLSWATFWHFEKFGHFLSLMLESELDHVRQQGAAMACAAALNNIHAKTFQEQAMNGDDAMKRGAANTYALYVRRSDFRERCVANLLRLMNAEDKEVKRQICWSFNNLKPTDLNAIRTFIYEFIKSSAFAMESWQLINYIKDVAIFEHELTLDVTEAFIKVIKDTESHDLRHDDDIVSLPLTVYNRSTEKVVQNRAIELFEELLELGVYGAQKALSQWDEHRDWQVLLASKS